MLGRVKVNYQVFLARRRSRDRYRQIEGKILDIAGIRLICQFTDDIYNVADLIRAKK